MVVIVVFVPSALRAQGTMLSYICVSITLAFCVSVLSLTFFGNM